MTDFSLGDTFDLITIPDASFFHIPNQEDRIRCLQSSRRHLRNGGGLFVDLIPPRLMAHQTLGEVVVIKEGPDQAGNSVRELNEKLEIDKSIQKVKVRHTFVASSAAGETHLSFDQCYSWVEELEMEAALAAAGFSFRVFGEYGLAEFIPDTSARMIFVGEAN